MKIKTLLIVVLTAVTLSAFSKDQIFQSNPRWIKLSLEYQETVSEIRDITGELQQLVDVGITTPEQQQEFDQLHQQLFLENIQLLEIESERQTIEERYKRKG